jgi:hypothetical protein
VKPTPAAILETTNLLIIRGAGLVRLRYRASRRSHETTEIHNKIRAEVSARPFLTPSTLSDVMMVDPVAA